MSVLVDVLVWIILNLGLVLGVIAFGIGLALIPLLGMVSAGAMPGFLAEPVASNLWKVVLSARGGARIHQTETDEYEIRPATGDEGPRNYWSRLFGRPFGVSYQRSKEAFRDRVERLDPGAMVTDGGASLAGKREAMDLARGGLKTFIQTGEEPGLFVRAGEKLIELKDTDGLDVVNVAEDETLKTEAGDTGMETKWRVIFWLGMAFFGSLGGAGVFFII